LLLGRELSSCRVLLQSGSRNNLAWFKTNRYQIFLDASDSFSLRCTNHWTKTVHQRIAKHRVVQDREPYQDVPCYLRLMLPLVG
jgi:hypothetical protein